MKKRLMIFAGLLGISFAFMTHFSVNAMEDGIYDPMKDPKNEKSCPIDYTKSLDYQVDFLCDELGLDRDEYIEYDEDGSITARTAELQEMYLKKLGYDGIQTVVDDEETVKYKHLQYSFKLEKVIETESCYSKYDIEHIGEDEEYVVKPIYSIDFNSCRLSDGLTIKLNKDEALDQVIDAANASTKEYGVNKFVIDSYDTSNTSYYYLEGECLYTQVYYQDENSLGYSCKMLGPNDEELAETEKDELLYKYMGLEEDELIKDKKDYLNMIYFQFARSSMDISEALKKYDELLANLKSLSFKDLDDIYDEAINRVIDERLAAIEASLHEEGGDIEADLLGAGYYQELVGNIPTLKLGKPAKICTRLIHDCPIVDLYDANDNFIVGCAVFDTEFTKYKYAYIVYLGELDDGHISLELAGTNDSSKTGINMVQHSTVETENGMSGVENYYIDAYGGEDVEGYLDPYADSDYYDYDDYDDYDYDDEYYEDEYYDESYYGEEESAE